MRDYAKVAPVFWTRGSGKKLRGKVDAQLVGLYVVTCPNANMVGVYYLPLVTLLHETGLPEDRARAALGVLAGVDFAHYDEASDLVWVPNAAGYQMGDGVDIGENRRKGVQREIDVFGRHPFVVEFYRRYAEPFRLTPPAWVADALANPLPTPFHPPSNDSDPPSKPVPRGSESVAVTVAVAVTSPVTGDHSTAAPPAGAGVPNADPILAVVEPSSQRSKRGTRIAPDWTPKPETLDAFRAEGIDAEACVAEFVDHWVAVSGAKGVKLDWEATFRNRVRFLKEAGRAPRWLPKSTPPSDAEEPTIPPEQAEAIMRDAFAALHEKRVDA